MSNKYSSDTDEGQYVHDYIKMANEDKEKAIMNPGIVDEAKWEKAKAAVKKEYGEYKWPVVMYVYEKMGGKTHSKS